MDLNSVDERLIRRGELLLSLEFVDGYDGELRAMNLGKVGRPYVLTERYAEFLSVVRYLFGFPYRQLEGFTRALNRLVPKLPSTDYSGLRRRILSLGPSAVRVSEAFRRACGRGGGLDWSQGSQGWRLD